MYMLVLMLVLTEVASSGVQTKEYRLNDSERNRQQLLTPVVLQGQNRSIVDNSTDSYLAAYYAREYDANANVERTHNTKLSYCSLCLTKHVRKDESLQFSVSIKRGQKTELQYPVNTSTKFECWKREQTLKNDGTSIGASSRGEFVRHNGIELDWLLIHELNRWMNDNKLLTKGYAYKPIIRNRRYVERTGEFDPFMSEKPLKIYFRSSPQEDIKSDKINVHFAGISPAFFEISTDDRYTSNQPIIEQASKPKSKDHERLLIEHKLHEIEAIEMMLERANRKVEEVKRLSSAKNASSNASNKTVEGWLRQASQTIVVLQNQKATIIHQLKALRGRLHRSRWQSAMKYKLQVAHNVKNMNQLRHRLQKKKMQVTKLKHILNSQDMQDSRNAQERRRLLADMIRKNQVLWKLKQKYREKNKVTTRLKQLQRENSIKKNVMGKQRWLQNIRLRKKISQQATQLKALRHDNYGSRKQLLSSNVQLSGLKNKTKALQTALRIKSKALHDVLEIKSTKKQMNKHQKQSEQSEVDLNKKPVNQKQSEQHKVDVLSKKLSSRKKAGQRKAKILFKKLGTMWRNNKFKNRKIKTLDLKLRKHKNLLDQLGKFEEKNQGNREKIQKFERQLNKKQHQMKKLKRVYKKKTLLVKRLKHSMQHIGKLKQKAKVELIRKNLGSQKTKLKNIQKQMRNWKQEIANSKKRLEIAKLSRKQAIKLVVEAAANNKPVLTEDKQNKLLEVPVMTVATIVDLSSTDGGASSYIKSVLSNGLKNKTTSSSIKSVHPNNTFQQAIRRKPLRLVIDKSSNYTTVSSSTESVSLLNSSSHANKSSTTQVPKTTKPQRVVKSKLTKCDTPCINTLLFKIVRRMTARSWTVIRRVQEVLHVGSYPFSNIATSLNDTSVVPETAATRAVLILVNVSHRLNEIAMELAIELKRRNLVSLSRGGKASVDGSRTGMADNLFNMTTVNNAVISVTRTLVKQSFQLARRLSLIDARDSIDLMAEVEALNEFLLSGSHGRLSDSRIVSNGVAHLVVKLAHMMHRVGTTLANTTLHTIKSVAEPPVKSGTIVANPKTQRPKATLKQDAVSELSLTLINQHILTILRSMDKWSRLLYGQTVIDGVSQAPLTDYLLPLTGPEEAAHKTARIIMKLMKRLKAVANSVKNSIGTTFSGIKPKSANGPLKMGFERNKAAAINLLLVSVIQRLVVQVDHLHQAVHLTISHLDDHRDELSSVSIQLTNLQRVVDDIQSNRLNSVEAVATALGSVLIWFTKAMKILASHVEMEFLHSKTMHSFVEIKTVHVFQTTTVSSNRSPPNVSVSIDGASNDMKKQYKAVMVDLHNAVKPVIVLNKTIRPPLNFNDMIRAELCHAVLDIRKHTRSLHHTAVSMLHEQSVPSHNTLFTILLSVRDTLRQTIRSSGLLTRAILEMYPECKADVSQSYDQSDVLLEHVNGANVAELVTLSSNLPETSLVTPVNANIGRGSSTVLNELSLSHENKFVTHIHQENKLGIKLLHKTPYSSTDTKLTISYDYKLQSSARPTVAPITSVLSSVPASTYTPTTYLLDTPKMPSDGAITPQKIADQMLQSARLISEIGQTIYWNVKNVRGSNQSNDTFGIQAMSGSIPRNVEDVWKEYMNGLMLAARTLTEKYQDFLVKSRKKQHLLKVADVELSVEVSYIVKLLNQLTLLSKRIAVIMLRLYSAIHKAANKEDEAIGGSLERSVADDPVFRQYRNFHQPDVTGMKHSLFGCDIKHVDYALPSAVNLISVGGRITATQIDGGYIVAGLRTSVPHQTNGDVAIELVFNNAVRIVGIAFPHTPNVGNNVSFVQSTAVFIEQKDLVGTWTPVVDTVSKQTMTLPVSMEAAPLPSLLQYKPLITGVRLYPRLWTGNNPLISSPLFVVCRLSS